jgi:hypothetical protein
MDEPALVDLAQRPGHTDSKAQKAADLHGCAEQLNQRLAAGVVEHQHRATAFAHELQGPHRPGTIQLILQVMITSEAIENGGWRMFGGGPHNQYVAAAAMARAPPSTEDAFAVLPHRLEPPIPPALNREDGFNCRTPWPD